MNAPITPSWRDRLYPRLAGQPTPLLIFPDQVWTAASIWAGARQWTGAFRDSGIAPGDRIICALPAGAAFVQLLIASLWEGLTLAVVAPREVSDAGAAALIDQIDARLLVSEHGAASAFTFAPSAAGWPDTPLPLLRTMQEPAEHDARLLLRTSGTSGAPRWIALSDANLFAVLDSHLPLLDLADATVLSVLPWHHAFGLVLGLLASLLTASEIVRDGSDGRDLSALLALASEHPITHVDLVPLLATRLFDISNGAEFLRRLRGGIVGGAPVSAALAARLQSTRLRVGYGQTEASPGILLGHAGDWSPRFIGAPVGCDVRIDDDHVLAFRGANACLGEWRNGTFVRQPPERWVRTGDVVERLADGGFRFIGRASDAFKLSNGRFVDAARYEDVLRAAFPDATALLLRAHDDGLELLCTAPDGTIDHVAAQHALGAHGGMLLPIRYVGATAWRFTHKGDVDRARPLRDELR